MNTTVLFLYFFEMLGTTAIFYGLDWLVMRPKDDRKVPHPVLWHLCGILLTNVCAVIFRFVAMFTFAGKSALSGDDSAYFYVIIMPTIFAALYITWLKNKAV